MAIRDYKTVSQENISANSAKTSNEWQPPSKYLEKVNTNSDLIVLDVPRTCGILNEKQIDISENYDATALLEKMAAKQLGSSHVVLAFCKMAAITQQLINCHTEIMFEEALARAKACDEYLTSKGTIMGPLYGLPISLKDSFNVKGNQTTTGFVSFVSHPMVAINSAISFGLVAFFLHRTFTLALRTSKRLPESQLTGVRAQLKRRSVASAKRSKA